MGEAKRLVKNTGIIAIGGMATKLVQFLLLPLYTSCLSPAEFGIVDYLNVIATFCIPVVSLLMDEALFRYLLDCETVVEKKRAVSTACCLLASGSLLLLGVAVLVEIAFHPNNLFWGVSLVLTGVFLQMVSALLRGFGDTARYALANFLASALTIALNVLFIVSFHWGVVGMLSATVISRASVALIFAIRCRVWEYFDAHLLNRDYLLSMLKYSVPLIPNKVSWTIMNLSDRLVIMNVMGSTDAGIYAVAYKFPNVMDQVYGFFYLSWKESSTRALNSDDDEVMFYNAVYATLKRFMLSVVIGMTALMPLVYRVMVSGEYYEGMKYVPILLLATFFENISGFYGGIYTAHKDTRIMGTTTVVAAAICLVLNVILIPQIGLWGASISTLIALLVVNEYRRHDVRRYAALVEDKREILISLVALVVCCFLYYRLLGSGSVLCQCALILLACVFFIWANFNLIKTAMGSIKRRAKNG